jgi:C2 domain
MTQVGALPLGAGKGLMHGVEAAGKNVIGVFMRDHGVSGSKTSLEIPPNGHPRKSLDNILPTTQLSRPADYTDRAFAELPPSNIVPAQVSNGGPRVPDDFGVLKVTILGAKDLVGASVGDTVKPYVVVKVGDKEQKTKHTGKTVTPEW